MAKFNLNQLLSNVSKSSQHSEEVSKKVDTLQLIPISVHDLIPSKENFYSVENIEELKDSIEMFGVKQNLTVKQLEEDKYLVISGHRRRLASLALVEEGKKEFEFLPCCIETELDSIKERLLLIITNSTARQLSDWEKVKQAEEMRKLLEEYKKKEKLPGRTREIIASILNTSQTQIARMDSISKNLSEEFKEEFKEEKINISTAYEISTLPKEVQQDVFSEYTESGSITISDVKEKKGEVKRETEEPAKEKENIENSPKEDLEIKEEVKKEVSELLPSLPSLYEILKGMSIKELAAFICSRCDSIGRFCDFAMECNQSKANDRQAICIRWLEMQAQKK